MVADVDLLVELLASAGMSTSSLAFDSSTDRLIAAFVVASAFELEASSRDGYFHSFVIYG